MMCFFCLFVLPSGTAGSPNWGSERIGRQRKASNEAKAADHQHAEYAKWFSKPGAKGIKQKCTKKRLRLTALGEAQPCL